MCIARRMLCNILARKAVLHAHHPGRNSKSGAIQCSQYNFDAPIRVSPDAVSNTMSCSVQSWAGSGACLVAGMLASMACVLFLQATNNGGGPLQALSTGRIAWSCSASALVGAITESLPISEIDNITVPLAVVFAGHCMF